MPNVPQQPTVLVKKADGTTVRLTLAEIQQLRNAEIQDNHNIPDFRDIQDNHDIKDNRDNRDIPKWKKEDHQSLLEEPFEHDKHVAIPAQTQTSGQAMTDKGPDQQIQRILEHLPFTPPENISLRLRSLVVSRLKDIRSDDQVEEYAQRSIDKSGLGFSQAQAKQLISSIQAVIGQERRRSLESSSAYRMGMVKEKFLEPSIPPASSTVTKFTPPRLRQDYGLAKPVLHDVYPAPEPTPPSESAPRVMGPVEEIGNLSIVDFRRLGTTVEERKQKLIAKFDIIKKESYLIYMDAMTTWYQSPLYRSYQTTIRLALEKGQTIAELLSREKDGLRPDEMLAIAEVNKILDF